MENLEIGIVTITYNNQGDVVSADFNPTMRIEVQEDLKQQLISVKENEDSEKLQANADLVMGAWFSKITDIELADRSEYHIVSELLRCNRYPDGKVRLCSMLYKFEKINP